MDSASVLSVGNDASNTMKGLVMDSTQAKRMTAALVKIANEKIITGKVMTIGEAMRHIERLQTIAFDALRP